MRGSAPTAAGVRVEQASAVAHTTKVSRRLLARKPVVTSAATDAVPLGWTSTTQGIESAEPCSIVVSGSPQNEVGSFVTEYRVVALSTTQFIRPSSGPNGVVAWTCNHQ